MSYQVKSMNLSNCDVTTHRLEQRLNHHTTQPPYVNPLKDLSLYYENKLTFWHSFCTKSRTFLQYFSLSYADKFNGWTTLGTRILIRLSPVSLKEYFERYAHCNFYFLFIILMQPLETKLFLLYWAFQCSSVPCYLSFTVPYFAVCTLT